jgi:hypothetical protein
VQLLRQYFCAKKVQTLNLSTKKALRETLAQNVGQIVTCVQFHQHITCSFCANILAPNEVQT